MALNRKVQHSEPRKAKVNGIEIVHDTFGKRSATPMLLVMGLGAQMIAWDEDFCEQLAAQGYWVIRFDNRDVGLSTRFDTAGVPDIAGMLHSFITQSPIQDEPPEVPYLLQDMADDAVDLLDALGIKSAHVVGVSMGGMIVQQMAIRYPDRVRTMTSIMSSIEPKIPPSQSEAMAVLLKPAPVDRAVYIEHAIAGSRVLHGTALPFDEVHARKRAERAFDRGLNPEGTVRQLAAILASGSRKEALKSVRVPTLVIHGDVDPLVPVEGGIETAEAIPGAELLVIKGMGHALPKAIYPQVIEAIARHAV